MQPIRVYSVIPRLPEKLAPLWELAYNLWFSWNNDIAGVFSQMDLQLWKSCNENPVVFLNRVPQRILEELASDEIYVERVKEAVELQRRYMGKKGSSVDFPGSGEAGPVVAYFSLEYGIALPLPIYSGGLGILAGDHLKSSSDLNIPLVAVGLLYEQGYFQQYMTPDGWQQERYPSNDFEQMPLTLIKDEDGNQITVTVDLAGQPLTARVWRADVGRVRLYLMDTDIAENPPHLRGVTSRLYGGGLEMRLWQEILLGIGGIKMLDALGLTPKVIHMNEGHSAFAGLERIRHNMEEHKLPFEAAMELAASSSVFTTHTPVPAGNDRFPPDLMQRYFEGYAQAMGLAFKVLLALGREDPRDDGEHFCMTVLALRLSHFSNGVSRLHGHVSRNMWKRVWPQYPVEDVPIGHITNGIHAPTFVAPDIGLLLDKSLGPNWREDPDCERVWAQVESISDAELWRTHERLRARLVDFVRGRLSQQLQYQGARRRELEVAGEVLDPEALTIGFARRFATYKRATLLLREKDRLIRILTDKKKPVQFIFAGKAHPADNEGKKLIQELIALCRREDLRHSLVFLENYDMEIAKHMVSGCDIWLNNPRRPLEACGTSGMKAMVNGVLNFSTLDGWWDEAWLPDNSVGFSIGKGEEYEDHAYQDFVEAQTLFNVLENDVIPEFYDRGHGGMPRTWVRKMKKGIMRLGPVFNSHRMVADYATTAYGPAIEVYDKLCADSFAGAKELAAWRMDMMTKWGGLQIRDVTAEPVEQVYVGESVTVTCKVQLNGIAAEDVCVEIYSGSLDNQGKFANRKTATMQPKGKATDGWQAFEGTTEPVEAGRFGFNVRIVPWHSLLLDPHALGLISWAPAE